MILLKEQLMVNDFLKEFLSKVKNGHGGKIIHLSHIDLDGYGASYVMHQVTCGNIFQLNCNYGEILNTLKKVNFSEDDYLLITDLNLNAEEAEYISNITSNWQVIDHHASGKDIAAKFPDNYFIDTSFSATKLLVIAINFLLQSKEASYDGNQLIMARRLENISSIVNAYDMWILDDKLYPLGQLLTNYINTSFFVDVNLNRRYIFEVLFGSILFSAQMMNKGDIARLEHGHSAWFRRYLSDNFGNKDYVNNDVPINIISAYLHEDVIKDYITFQNDECVVLEGIPSSLTNALNTLLFKDPFFGERVLVNINKKGSVAFRSINERSKELAERIGGGGHPNASGGFIKPLADKSLLELFVDAVFPNSNIEIGDIVVCENPNYAYGEFFIVKAILSNSADEKFLQLCNFSRIEGDVMIEENFCKFVTKYDFKRKLLWDGTTVPFKTVDELTAFASQFENKALTSRLNEAFSSYIIGKE